MRRTPKRLGGRLLDLVRLEEPACSDEYWFTTKSCTCWDATILVAVKAAPPAWAPDVIDFLRKWGFSIDTYKGVVGWREENPDAGTNDTAIWRRDSNADVWSGWAPDTAAQLIRTELAAGKTSPFARWMIPRIMEPSGRAASPERHAQPVYAGASVADVQAVGGS